MLDIKINRPDAQAEARCRARWDAVAKPLNSLGRLEDMIRRIAGIQGTEQVRLTPRCALIFCGDHGVVKRGVAQSDQSVTSLVARSIAEGEANINMMAAVSGTDVFCVDMGMARPVDHPAVINRRVGPGTRDMTQGPAMTRDEAVSAIQAGCDLVGDMKRRGYRIVLTGEMGIGNTTAASALCMAALNLSAEEAVGRGAGLSDEGLARKRRAVEKAVQVNDVSTPLDALASVGGFEIAAMTGAFLGGMTWGVPVVVDGVTSAAAALYARRMYPEAAAYMLPSHMSRERLMSHIMREIGLEPVIDAGMALGEGTGAAALMPILDMALAVYDGKHTFTNLGMEAYTPQGGGV